MGNINGVLTTANIVTAKQIIDMSNVIATLSPTETPFISLLKQVKSMKEDATNPKFHWLEDDLVGRKTQLNMAGNAAADATKLIFDDGTIFAVGDVINAVATNENMIVTALNPDGDNVNEITVTRAYGTTTAAIIADNAVVLIVGNVSQEFSGTRVAKTTEVEDKFNYTQIFKTPFGISGTAKATSVYGGVDELAYQRNKAGIQHLIDIGRAFYFGQKKLDTSGTYVARATGGILSFATENIYNANGSLTQASFEQNLCKNAFLYGSDKKMLFSDATLLSVINGWALGKLQINQEAKKYGLAVYEYISPFGILNIIYDRILNDSTYNGVVLDVEEIKYRPLKGRDTKLETNLQDNDEDGIKEQYITECGLEFRNPKKHASIYGVTG